MNVVELENIKIDYRNKRGHFRVDIDKFTLEKGIITALIGKNSKGKTTLMKVILNELKIKNGSVSIFNKTYENDEIYIKERIGSNGNIPTFDMRVEKVKKLIAPIYKNWDEDYYKKLIEKFSIDESLKLKELSAGKFKILEIVLELSKKPELLILDEPTTHIDLVLREKILRELKNYVYDNEATLLITSHITSDLDLITDYIYYLDEGKILLSDYKENIMENKIIVKGSKEFLIDEVKEKLIFLRENRYGFEGIGKNYEEIFELLGNEVIYEKPTFENLVLWMMEEL